MTDASPPATPSAAADRPASSRRGPRRDGDARADIVTAARRLFAERGYEGTSLRAVAREAGVDPALVHHYFDGKPNLYADSIGLDVDPGTVLRAALAGGPDRVPELLLRGFLDLWADPEAAERLRGVVAGILTRPEAATAYREFVISAVLGPIAESLGVDHPQRRAALVASQMIGLALARYVVRIEPLAGAPVEVVVADVAPTLRRYLFEALPEVLPDS